MRRSVLFAATIALFVATAVGMFAAAIVLKPPPLSARTADGTKVVHRFYDAINTVLRTGDPAALGAIVAPHFAMHGAFVAVSPDRAGLARQLVATSAVAPDLQLEVEELAVADDRALVHLMPTSDAGSAFLGVPFASPGFWGRFDALRIHGGQVVELWSGADPVPLFESLSQSRLDPLPKPNHTMMFRRLSAEAGHSWTWTSTYQSRVLYVEVGALLVEVDPGSEAPAVIFAPGDGHGQGRSVPPGASARLLAGQVLALSASAGYRLHGVPSSPDWRAYEVAFPRFTGISSSGAVLADSTIVGTPPPSKLPTREVLAESAQTGLAHDALIASFGRFTLPPGRTLVLGEAPGPVLLTVEAGSLGVDQRQTDPATGATTVVPGAATIMPVGEAITLQAGGPEPVVVFVVSIVPAHAGTRVVPSSHSMLSGT